MHTMYKIFRENKNARKWTVALAVLLAVALCSAAVFGAITNCYHKKSPYLEYQMNKTLTPTADGYALELTAGGFDTAERPIYTVLALDATSSMVITDGGDRTRWEVVLKAAKAYAEAFFEAEDGHEKYLAIVSFGYGARVHVTKDFAEKYNISAATVPSNRLKSPDGTINPVTDYFIGGYRS